MIFLIFVLSIVSGNFRSNGGYHEANVSDSGNPWGTVFHIWSYCWKQEGDLFIWWKKMKSWCFLSCVPFLQQLNSFMFFISHGIEGIWFNWFWWCSLISVWIFNCIGLVFLFTSLLVLTGLSDFLMLYFKESRVKEVFSYHEKLFFHVDKMVHDECDPAAIFTWNIDITLSRSV